jgi:hypothetical protein
MLEPITAGIAALLLYGVGYGIGQTIRGTRNNSKSKPKFRPSPTPSTSNNRPKTTRHTQPFYNTGSDVSGFLLGAFVNGTANQIVHTIKNSAPKKPKGKKSTTMAVSPYWNKTIENDPIDNSLDSLNLPLYSLRYLRPKYSYLDETDNDTNPNDDLLQFLKKNSTLYRNRLQASTPTSTYNFTIPVTPKYQSKPSITQYHPQPMTDILFHGTPKMKNARDIFRNNVWNIKMNAVFLADNFELTKKYAGKKGGIVVVKKSPGLKLQRDTNWPGAYKFPIDDAKPSKEFYRINGLTPIGILNPEGELIAGRMN